MPTIDDSGLDPQRRERIRSRTLDKGVKMRRRRTIVRRSVTASAVVVLAGGGVLIARTAGVASGSGPNHHVSVAGASSTTTTGPTPTTVGNTGGATTTTTTIPGNGGGEPTTTTTIPFTNTTTTIPTTTTTTIPVTTTTVTAPVGTRFQKSLSDIVEPGTLSSTSWTVPANKPFELSTFTISTSDPRASGDIRVQLMESGYEPEDLFDAEYTELGSPFEVTLATPAPFLPGETLTLTASCDADQPACATSFSFAGTLWTSSPNDDAYAGSLPDIVAPGTDATAQWTVPSGERFSLSDLLLSSLSAGIKGEVYVQTVAGGAPSTLLQMSLASLGKQPVYDPVGSLTLNAGTQLSITVACDANQAACDTALLFTGHLTTPGG
jgi:hypothetical protein